MELDKAELVDKLAQHRTDNAEEKDLRDMYYNITYDSLDEYSDVELAKMVEVEMDES